MTPLRKKMLEELQRRNYAESTKRAYLHIVADFAKYFGRSPDLLGLDEIREYQAHLINKRKLDARTVGVYTAGSAVSLRQDSPPIVPATGISVSEAATQIADHSERKRDFASDRERQQPLPSRLADDPVLHGSAKGRGMQPEGRGHR